MEVLQTLQARVWSPLQFGSPDLSLTLVSWFGASLVWLSASQQSCQTRMVRVLIHGSLD